MAGYNPNTVEQEIVLKDGRTIYKTHNGFKAYVKDQSGNVSPITQDYYNRVKSNKA